MEDRKETNERRTITLTLDVWKKLMQMKIDNRSEYRSIAEVIAGLFEENKKLKNLAGKN